MKISSLLVTLVFGVISAVSMASTTTLVSFQGRADLSNLFLDDQKVDFRSYGIEEGIAHNYTLKTTYSFPAELKAKVNIKVFPPSSDCNSRNGFCRPQAGYKSASLKFSGENLKVTWELFDSLTGRSLGKHSEGLTINFYKSGIVEEDIYFNGVYSNGWFSSLENTVSFSIPSSQQLKVSFRKSSVLHHLKGTSFELIPMGMNEYRLNNVIFDHRKLETSLHFNGEPYLSINGFNDFKLGETRFERPGFMNHFVELRDSATK